jgi:hypothetical protein
MPVDYPNATIAGSAYRTEEKQIERKLRFNADSVLDVPAGVFIALARLHQFG